MSCLISSDFLVQNLKTLNMPLPLPQEYGGQSRLFQRRHQKQLNTQTRVCTIWKTSPSEREASWTSGYLSTLLTLHLGDDVASSNVVALALYQKEEKAHMGTETGGWEAAFPKALWFWLYYAQTKSPCKSLLVPFHSKLLLRLLHRTFALLCTVFYHSWLNTSVWNYVWSFVGLWVCPRVYWGGAVKY